MSRLQNYKLENVCPLMNMTRGFMEKGGRGACDDECKLLMSCITIM